MAPFYGWGSTASRLEPLQGGSLLFTTCCFFVSHKILYRKNCKMRFLQHRDNGKIPGVTKKTLHVFKSLFFDVM